LLEDFDVKGLHGDVAKSKVGHTQPAEVQGHQAGANPRGVPLAVVLSRGTRQIHTHTHTHTHFNTIFMNLGGHSYKNEARCI
jgi:hypothetical protein